MRRHAWVSGGACPRDSSARKAESALRRCVSPVVYSLLMVAGMGATAVADSVLSETGQRIEGRIVEITAENLIIEVSDATSKKNQQIPHAQIRFIRQTAPLVVSTPTPVPAPTPTPLMAIPQTTQPVVMLAPTAKPIGAGTQPAAKGKMDLALRDQLLAEVFVAYRQNKLEKVVNNLSRIARACSDEELEQASQKCQEALGKQMAQILAELRFNLAIEQGQGRTLDLQGSTAYESPALCSLLANLYNKLMSLFQTHLEDPKMYQGEPKEASDLLPKAQLLMATIRERLRLDNSIIGEAKVELQDTLKDVSALIPNLKLRSEDKPTEAMKIAARKTPTVTPTPPATPQQVRPTPTPQRGRSTRTPDPRFRPTQLQQLPSDSDD